MLLLLAVAALASGCATLDERQRAWIFQPSDRSWWRGEEAAAGMGEVWIRYTARESGEPVQLHGLWLAHENLAARTDAPVLLYLHGARFNVVGSAFRARRMQELGFSVLTVDYRGFGKSTKQLPSEAMAVEDARAAWDWLGQQYPGRPRYIFGHSLGGAIAIELAAQVGRRGRHPGRRHLHLDSRCGELVQVGLAAGGAVDHPAFLKPSSACRKSARHCWWCTAAKTS